MLSSFNEGQSEVSLCTIWLPLNKKEMVKEGGGGWDGAQWTPQNLFNLQKAEPL